MNILKAVLRKILTVLLVILLIMLTIALAVLGIFAIYVNRTIEKSIDETLIFRIAGFDLQPFSEPLKSTFNIHPLADQTTDGQTANQKHGAAADKNTVFHTKHLLKGTCNGDKQRADTANLVKCILGTVMQKAAE